MKSLSFALIASFFLMLAGCAATPETKTANAPEREEKCRVTGSNLPKRDCLSDVSILPPSAVDSVLPTQPRSAPGN
jgi:PBP1b-binding outer membrane lipoprotein LpoB